jgi:hypothetical protein
METTTNPIVSATRHDKYRQVKFIWQSPNIDIMVDNGSAPWGEQIELELRHDPKRKRYEAVIRRVLWQPKDGWSVTMFTLFDRETYPSVCFYSEVVARYGDKSFAKFEADTLPLLKDPDMAKHPTLARLLTKVRSYDDIEGIGACRVFGGDGF